MDSARYSQLKSPVRRAKSPNKSFTSESDRRDDDLERNIQKTSIVSHNKAPSQKQLSMKWILLIATLLVFLVWLSLTLCLYYLLSSNPQAVMDALDRVINPKFFANLEWPIADPTLPEFLRIRKNLTEAPSKLISTHQLLLHDTPATANRNPSQKVRMQFFQEKYIKELPCLPGSNVDENYFPGVVFDPLGVDADVLKNDNNSKAEKSKKLNFWRAYRGRINNEDFWTIPWSVKVETATRFLSEFKLYMGIPTLYRKDTTYLEDLLNSLFNDHGLETWPSNVKVVILNAHFNPSDHQTLTKLQARYSKWFDERIIILHPDSPSYQKLKQPMKQNFDDQKVRVYWRSKQVLDFGRLFEYSGEACDYYVQLEDDIIAMQGYLVEMVWWLARYYHSRYDWSILSFYSSTSTTDHAPYAPSAFFGFIGQLFRASEARALSKFFSEKFDEKPVDWLIIDYIKMLDDERQEMIKLGSNFSSGLETTQKNPDRIFSHVPAVFQHVGVKSSMEGKRQNAQGHDFYRTRQEWLDIPPATPLITNATKEKFAKNFSKKWRLHIIVINETTTKQSSDISIFEQLDKSELNRYHTTLWQNLGNANSLQSTDNLVHKKFRDGHRVNCFYLPQSTSPNLLADYRDFFAKIPSISNNTDSLIIFLDLQSVLRKNFLLDLAVHFERYFTHREDWLAVSIDSTKYVDISDRHIIKYDTSLQGMSHMVFSTKNLLRFSGQHSKVLVMSPGLAYTPAENIESDIWHNMISNTNTFDINSFNSPFPKQLWQTKEDSTLGGDNRKVVGRIFNKNQPLYIGIHSHYRNQNYLFFTLDNLLAVCLKYPNAKISINVLLSSNYPTESVLLNRYKGNTGIWEFKIWKTTSDYEQIQEAMTRTWEDAVNRVKWRSRMVLDFVALSRLVRGHSQTTGFYLALHDDVKLNENFFIDLATLIEECESNTDLQHWTQIAVRDSDETKSIVPANKFAGIHAQAYKMSKMNNLLNYLKENYYKSPLDWLIRDFHVGAQSSNASSPIIALKHSVHHYGMYSTLSERGSQIKRF